MAALIVVETYFGNTRQIADIVADTLCAADMQAQVVGVGSAPTHCDADVDLLVVGAPTHDLGLSTPATRKAAGARTGKDACGPGVREWVAQLSLPAAPPLVAVYDTRTGCPWLAGSAAAQASVLLSERGFPVMAARETFRVHGVAGPLLPGEDDRARRWTKAVTARFSQRRGIRRG